MFANVFKAPQEHVAQYLRVQQQRLEGVEHERDGDDGVHDVHRTCRAAAAKHVDIDGEGRRDDRENEAHEGRTTAEAVAQVAQPLTCEGRRDGTPRVYDGRYEARNQNSLQGVLAVIRPAPRCSMCSTESSSSELPVVGSTLLLVSFPSGRDAGQRALVRRG
jgi:hypothetical protein